MKEQEKEKKNRRWNFDYHYRVEVGEMRLDIDLFAWCSGVSEHEFKVLVGSGEGSSSLAEGILTRRYSRLPRVRLAVNPRCHLHSIARFA